MTQHHFRCATRMLVLAIGLCVMHAQTSLAGNKLTSLVRSFSHADRPREIAAEPKATKTSFWKRSIHSVSKFKPQWPFHSKHDAVTEQTAAARPAYSAGATAADIAKKPVAIRRQRPVTTTPAPTTWSQLRAAATTDAKLTASDDPAPPPVRPAGQLNTKLGTMPSRKLLAPPLQKTPTPPTVRPSAPARTVASTPPAKPAITPQSSTRTMHTDLVQRPTYPQTSPRVITSGDAATAPVVSAATYRQTLGAESRTATTQYVSATAKPAPAGTWLATYQQLLTRTPASANDTPAKPPSHRRTDR